MRLLLFCLSLLRSSKVIMFSEISLRTFASFSALAMNWNGRGKLMYSILPAEDDSDFLSSGRADWGCRRMRTAGAVDSSPRSDGDVAGTTSASIPRGGKKAPVGKEKKCGDLEF